MPDRPHHHVVAWYAMDGGPCFVIPSVVHFDLDSIFYFKSKEHMLIDALLGASEKT